MATRRRSGELLKFRTARLPLALPGTAAGLTAVMTVPGAARVGAGHMAPPPLHTIAARPR